MEGKLQTAAAMAVYMLVVIGIGIYYNKRSSENSSNYFIGGRSLGPWVAAMSAEASDMSGWLLMGLPGVAYWTGLSDALWTAIGLAIGTYINWLVVARRLRSYSVVAGNAITIPEFISNRYKENKKIIMSVAAVFILVFFTVYAASCFVTCGKLFSALFGIKYQYMMLLGAAFVIFYTYIGGFLAESMSDFLQGIVMIFALAVILVLGVASAGGIGNVIENVRAFPGFLEFFGIASPETTNGVQNVVAGSPAFGAAGKYGFLVGISAVDVLMEFNAIRIPTFILSGSLVALRSSTVSYFGSKPME